MKILPLRQGSAEWLAHRSKSGLRNASDASIMMGCSPHVSRSEFVRMRATGVSKEYSQYVREVVFATGKAVEEATRPIIADEIGQPLYPVTATSDDGVYGASFDGITIDDSLIWECKQWNQSKAERVRNGEVPIEDRWQVIQGLYVSGAPVCRYTVSDGTPDKKVSCDFRAKPEMFAELIAGWEQLDADVAAYKATAPAIVAAQETLPAAFVSVIGGIEVHSNLPAFGEALQSFLARVDMAPATDQAFAEAEANIKTLIKAEEALETIEEQILLQLPAVYVEMKRIEAHRGAIKGIRAPLQGTVKAKKEEIKAEIAAAAKEQWEAHIAGLNNRLGVVRVTFPMPDFAAAMKHKRTIETLRGAVSDALAKGKIAATLEATQRAASLQEIYRFVGAYTITDLQDLTTIAAEHVGDVVKARAKEYDRFWSDYCNGAAERLQDKLRPNSSDLIKSAAEAWLVDEATALQWIIEIADERR